MGVGAALAGEDDVHFFEGVDVGGVDKGGLLLPEVGGGLSGLGGGEEGGLDVVEVVFCLHTFDEDGAYHAAPADDPCFHAFSPAFCKRGQKVFDLGGQGK